MQYEIKYASSYKNKTFYKETAGISCQIIREDNTTKLNLNSVEFTTKQELDKYIKKLARLSKLL